MNLPPGCRLAALVAALGLAALPGALRAQVAPEASEATAPAPEGVVARAAKEATLIVSGRILSTRTVAVDGGRRLMTLGRLRVERTFRLAAGTSVATGDEVEVVFPGGRRGALAQRVGGVPLIAAGDHLLLFLAPWPRPGADGPRRFTPSLLGVSVWRVAGSIASLAPEAVRLVGKAGAGAEASEAPRLSLDAVPQLLRKLEASR